MLTTVAMIKNIKNFFISLIDKTFYAAKLQKKNHNLPFSTENYIFVL